ncbi:MAG: FADH(2)-oxidizing methylenetetrahydrofolate--tRNA-(uracil(54)-C(5))-methyltransferase TrmFO, partial [Beijerinckiaceae bacterium]|nr:FADH(2)-oxidizing methylenetetrahydrofolate--tRNA-(uracil(54)-C(5))-methyltransferase TrmFO [Beijerinckiaceae bacterium]
TGGRIDSGPRSIDPGPRSFQPMNVNFGLFPPIDGPTVGPDGRRLRGPEKGVARKIALSRRAAADLDAWLAAPAPALAAE